MFMCCTYLGSLGRPKTNSIVSNGLCNAQLAKAIIGMSLWQGILKREVSLYR
jgi:hypothetical protein